MWTSRYRIVHRSRSDTHDETVRNQAYTYLLSLQSDPSQINYQHLSLLRRTRYFFFNALFATIQMWYSRAKLVVAYAVGKNRQLGHDIRNWDAYDLGILGALHGVTESPDVVGFFMVLLFWIYFLFSFRFWILDFIKFLFILFHSIPFLSQQNSGYFQLKWKLISLLWILESSLF